MEEERMQPVMTEPSQKEPDLLRGWSDRHRGILFFACLLAVVFAAWFWYSRPLSATDLVDGEPKKVNVSRRTIAMDFSEALETISTEDPEQIQQLLDFLDRHRVSRQIDWRALFGLGVEGYSLDEPVTFLNIGIHSQDASGEWSMFEYELVSLGHMRLYRWGDDAQIPCGVGRFGDGGVESFYQDAQAFFSDKKGNAKWRDTSLE